RLGADGAGPAALEQLRRETHKSHGAAGSFGFWNASRLAAGMEVTAKDWLSRPGDTDVERGALTNQRVSAPRSTSVSPGRESQSFAVTSMPAASRDAFQKPKDPAAPWLLWVSRRSCSNAAGPAPSAPR